MTSQDSGRRRPSERVPARDTGVWPRDPAEKEAARFAIERTINIDERKLTFVERQYFDFAQQHKISFIGDQEYAGEHITGVVGGAINEQKHYFLEILTALCMLCRVKLLEKEGDSEQAAADLFLFYKQLVKNNFCFEDPEFNEEILAYLNFYGRDKIDPEEVLALSRAINQIIPKKERTDFISARQQAMIAIINELEPPAKWPDEEWPDAPPLTPPDPFAVPEPGHLAGSPPAPPEAQYPDSIVPPEPAALKPPAPESRQVVLEKELAQLEVELQERPPLVQVIPDVHGSYKNLQEIYNEWADHAILLGDLIDRGPDSLSVVDFIRGKIESGHARLLLGNHEAMFIAAILYNDDIEAIQWILNGGDALLKERGWNCDFASADTRTAGARRFWQQNKDDIRQDSNVINCAEFLQRNSRIFIIEDGNLYVHGGIPLNPDGTLMPVGQAGLKGLALLKELQELHERGKLDYGLEAWGKGTPLFACNEYDRNDSWMQIMANYGGAQPIIYQLNEGLPNDQKIKRIFFGHDRDEHGRIKDFNGLIYGLDTAMSEGYTDHGGSMILDGNGIRYVSRPKDAASPYQVPLVIDSNPRTVADTDRGRKIKKRIKEIEAEIAT